MESYGELLKKTREAKLIDLDRASREISIEKRYLQGLEDEDNGVFPGDAYMIGFLKNYAEYLELDSNFLLKLYRNKQIQEAPLPQGLYERHTNSKIIPFVIVPIVLLVAVVVTVLILLNVKKNKNPEEGVIVSGGLKSHQYELTDQKFVQRVYKGDQLLIPTENEGKIILTVRDTLSAFGIDTPSGVYYVELAEESELDINGDNLSDMIVYVSDISSTDEKRGAEVNILLRHGVSLENTATVVAEEIPFASEVKTAHPYKVIHEDNRAYPFTINASFRGPCLFRDRVDNSQAVESYFARGDLFTATPRNGIRLWISNFNTVKITIIADSKSFDLDIGAAGQIYVEDIKWIKDTDGKYKLVVIELD